MFVLNITLFVILQQIEEAENGQSNMFNIVLDIELR